jgi:CheY-like chemotaxis protein/anti-sigma regulatory factor (Ser/Thr protein kinase)
MQVGDFPINPVPVSIYSVISKILEDNLRLTNGKRLHIEFRSRVADDMVIADRPAIETVFENIIDNAIKYTEKGSVEITLYRDDQKRLCVSVKDTGVGISGTYLTHLFEPYSQEETGYSRRYEGMGLGLPITKKLLALNDASISVSSKKGEGSLFTVCFANKLPMSLGAKPDTCVSEFSGIATAFPSTGDSMPAILVVEDEKENQFFMDMILKKYFEVVMAADGETALEQFRSRAFDLILMDISLSRGMNGLDLTKIIRAGTKHPDIPIIVVSGHAFPVDRQAALAAGGNDFLVKPFEINELLALVGKYMPEG